MANHLYGYSSTSSTYGAASTLSPAAPPKSSLSSLYASTRSSLTEPYLPESTLRYLNGSGSDHLFADPLSKYSSSSSSIMYRHLMQSSSSHLGSSQFLPHHSSWPPADPGYEPLPPGVKRPSEALYHPTLLGSYNTIGQTEAWYTTESLAKRSRLESTSHYSIYPQRPGEKDCTHYMQTRTCKFGESCKFDHPIWVPEGGIPDWKEAPVSEPAESYPERPGEPDCPYFLKTQRCKYASKCRFNHPKDASPTVVDPENPDALPERPFEPPCAFYMKTGLCKYGGTCKFNHPKDIQISSAELVSGGTEQAGLAVTIEGVSGEALHVTSTPALYHNTKGLPMRLGEVDCPFYLKTGSCKYGASCRYNHPDRNAFIPPAAVVGHPVIENFGAADPSGSVFQTLGVVPAIYPQRPGQAECDYYMKTGECKFSERCRFHHPLDRPAQTNVQASQPGTKFILAGLPRREGGVHCPYYMKTGMCKYGGTCKFDHPPPAEVMAAAISQATSTYAKPKALPTKSGYFSNT